MAELNAINSANGGQLAQQAAGSVSGRQDAASAAKQQAQATVEVTQNTVQRLEEATARLNQLMQDGQRSLNFSVEQTTDKVVVSVVDKNTGDLVRQIPTPEALKIAEYIDGLMGMVFDKKA